MNRRFWQWAVFGVVAWPAAAWAQDADGDGVANAVDAFPCDAQFSAAAYAPSQGAHGTVFFEDQWPSAGDLDFNDVVVSYHYELRYDALGRVVALHATFNPLALGGVFDNGLALHLPVPRGAVASASRTVEGGAPEALTVSLDDAELTLTVSNNLRELFSGQAGQINSTGTNTLSGLAVEVNLTFGTPVTLSAGPAPYDLFIFRSGVPGHQIHRPEFSGTAQMANSLFGTGDDGSAAGRWFVDGFGLPFALVVPQNVPYPSEGTAISSLFPNIVNFAASGGATHNDFYISSVNGAAYQGARVTPRFVTNRAASTTCVATGGYQLFTSSGVFTPPAGVTNVRVLVIGGGGGGGGGHQGGGGSGYVRYGNYSVSGPVTVTVGNGGNGAPGSASNDQPSGTNGAISSFGSHLSANGGETTPGVNTRGGHGGSGGGGAGNSGLGAAGGSGGGNGGAATYVGGTGQGSFTSLLNNFSRATLSVGTGGAGGTSSHGGGGGGGGVLVNGSGPSAGSGPHSISGRGGQGYGAGGGAGGYNGSWSPARAAGGAGATGMVLVEWDGSSGNADAGVADSGATDSGAAPTGNYQIFTTSGTFVPPAGVTTVRVLAVGGGGGGGGGHQGGGGSGYVRSGTFNVSGNVAVTVGSGGAGAPGSASNDQPSGVNGTATLFGAFLTANGGETTPGVNTRGGHGGSGGGGSGNSGVGAAGGANGANGGAATYQGGTGQGSFTSVLSIFTRATISAAAAGAGGTSSHGGGGGGGGVLIGGSGPSAGSGPQSTSGRGGQGYGAGGGAGGYNGSWSPARAAGGAGANGVVYVEW